MPTPTDALTLAIQHRVAGNLQDAEHTCRRILAANPNHPDAWHLLGVIALETAHYELAEEYISKAIQLDSATSSFYCNLGDVYQAQGRLDEAVALFRRAIELNPSDPELHYNLGNAFRAQELLQQAVPCYCRALELNPRLAPAYNNLGSTLQYLGRFDDAIACYRQAIEHNPHDSETYSNLGNAFQRLRQFDQAAACYDRALALDPQQHYARFSSATLKLLTGDFARGWPEYEWRWKLPELGNREIPQPKWNGDPLGKRSILLPAEQGLGDTIQFIRYAALVKEQNPAATVIVECPRPLTKLLAQYSGVDQLVTAGDAPPPFDVHLPLASLPGVFRSTLTTIPAAIPYLSANRALCDEWRAKLKSLLGLRIGINWRGRAFPDRDIPIDCFAELARLPGVQLISLQKNSPHHDVDAIAKGLPIINLGPDFDTHHGAFMDTAAVITNLDLVITSDTAIPHLAGALGIPVWLALPYVPEWRWLLDRPDTPWYPTMRLFRQQQPGDWTSVFNEIRAALNGRVTVTKPA